MLFALAWLESRACSAVKHVDPPFTVSAAVDNIGNDDDSRIVKHVHQQIEYDGYGSDDYDTDSDGSEP